MFCSTCGAVVRGGVCSGCGTRAFQLPVPADPSQRFWAYLIDLIPAVAVVLLFGWIPIIGAMIAGAILFVYWLLRDVTGASIGKRMLGLRVVGRDGTPSGVGGRILRNLPFAIGPGLLVVPLAGYVIAPPTAGLLVLLEAVLVATGKERIGDRLARTNAVKKGSAIAVAAGSPLIPIQGSPPEDRARSHNAGG